MDLLGHMYPYDTVRANVMLRISSDDAIVPNSGSTLKLEVSGTFGIPRRGCPQRPG